MEKVFRTYRTDIGTYRVVHIAHEKKQPRLHIETLVGNQTNYTWFPFTQFSLKEWSRFLHDHNAVIIQNVASVQVPSKAHFSQTPKIKPQVGGDLLVYRVPIGAERDGFWESYGRA